jgi:hypothetical protein
MVPDSIAKQIALVLKIKTEGAGGASCGGNVSVAGGSFEGAVLLFGMVQAASIDECGSCQQ